MVPAFVIITALALFGLAPAFAAEPGATPKSSSPYPAFLTAITDMPLMPGLREDLGAGVSFDKPQGRIVEATARGRISAAKVRAFYDATLPELGWRAQGGGRYRREGEMLRISFHPRGPTLWVRFSLSPN